MLFAYHKDGILSVWHVQNMKVFHRKIITMLRDNVFAFIDSSYKKNNEWFTVRYGLWDYFLFPGSEPCTPMICPGFLSNKTSMCKLKTTQLCYSPHKKLKIQSLYSSGIQLHKCTHCFCLFSACCTRNTEKVVLYSQSCTWGFQEPSYLSFKLLHG